MQNLKNLRQKNFDFGLVILLISMTDLKYKEIADIFNVPEKRIIKIANLAIREIRKKHKTELVIKYKN